jgi:hypothetical protein
MRAGLTCPPLLLNAPALNIPALNIPAWGVRVWKKSPFLGILREKQLTRAY